MKYSVQNLQKGIFQSPFKDDKAQEESVITLETCGGQSLAALKFEYKSGVHQHAK